VYIIAALLTALYTATAASKAKSSTTTLPSRSTPLSDVTFVVFDTETTGFSPTKDRILECGAVKCRNGKIIEEKTWLINPEREIHYWAQQAHGITQEELTNQPTFKAFYPEFRDFIRGSVLVAHNARFDVSFMSEEIKRADFPIPRNRIIDSLKLFRKWFPDAKSHTLSELAAYAEIDADVFHRALADSRYVYLILDKQLEKRKDIKTLGDLYGDAGGTLKF